MFMARTVRQAHPPRQVLSCARAAAKVSRQSALGYHLHGFFGPLRWLRLVVPSAGVWTWISVQVTKVVAMSVWRLRDFHDDDLDQAIQIWDQRRPTGEPHHVFPVSEVMSGRWRNRGTRGIGSALVTELERRLRALGVRRVGAVTRRGDRHEGARALRGTTFRKALSITRRSNISMQSTRVCWPSWVAACCLWQSRRWRSSTASPHQRQ